MTQLFERFEDFPKARASAICLGNFDGVHRGHQKILQTCLDVAKRQRLASIVFTFDPHPVKVLRPDKAPQLLMTRKEKREFLLGMGFDFILEQKFSYDFSKITAEDFMGKILAQSMSAKEIIVGENFTFGFQAKGNVNSLRSCYSFSTNAVKPVEDEDGVINSSRIRIDVASGKIEDANQMLGHPYFLEGEVVEGKRLGKTLGFPTANLKTKRECLPKSGIYFCKAEVLSARPEVKRGGGGEQISAAVSIGTNPTTDSDSSIKIEAHLLNFSGDLYGKSLRLNFFHRHRDEKKFASLDDLKSAISSDLTSCSQFFAS